MNGKETYEYLRQEFPQALSHNLMEKGFFMEIAVIIPSKNGITHLKECLPTVVKAASKAPFPVHITVVDDNSTDKTMEILSPLFPEVVFLRNSKKGASSARNWGVKNTPCDWICFLDNDVFLDEHFFNTVQKYLKQDVFCVACAGYTAYPKVSGALEQNDGIKLLEWKRGLLRFTGNIYNKELPLQPEYLSWGVQGAYFFCNRNKFDRLCGFDEILGPYMLEETDMVYRGLKRGWKIVYAPDTKPLHKCGGTIDSKKNKYTQFLSKRNRVLFVWKNITSKSLFISHIFWLLLRPNFKVLKSIWKFLPDIRNRRAIEIKEQMLTDKELLKQAKYFRKKCMSAMLQKTLKGEI